MVLIVDLLERQSDPVPPIFLIENNLIEAGLHELILKFFRVKIFGDVILHLGVVEDVFEVGAGFRVIFEHAAEELFEFDGKFP